MEVFRQIKVVSFDFGETLAYETTKDYVLFQQILKELGYDFPVEQVREAMKFARERWRTESHGKVWNENEMIKFHKNVLSRLRVQNLELAIKTARMLPQRLGFKAYDDAEATLKELKKRGYRLIIISNVSSKSNLETYLKKAGLNGYFEALFASGSMGVEKPSPQIFCIAVNEMNIPSHEMLHVGDSYENDYLGAKNAGVNAVLLDRREKYGAKECRRISSLNQLLELLAK